MYGLRLPSSGFEGQVARLPGARWGLARTARSAPPACIAPYAPYALYDQESPWSIGRSARAPILDATWSRLQRQADPSEAR